MKSTLKEKALIVYLEGRITSVNAKELETQIFEALQTSHEEVIIDFSHLEYISSAGLRVILRVRKKEANLRCVELSPEVYEIFEMTGFIELMPVEKAFEKVSIEGCKQIGKGANGMVYKLNEEEIVKVYKNPDSLEDIYREKDLAKTAFVLGIPTAMSFNVVKVGDLYGAKYEMLNADSLVACLQKNKIDVDTCVEMSVDIMKTMHESFVEEGKMPPIKAIYAKKMQEIQPYLPEDTYQKSAKMFDEIPEPLSIVHGDFHFKNILVQDTEALLIDMDTLCTGYPIFEFIPIYTAYVGHGELDPAVIEKFMSLPYKTTKEIWKKTLQAYFSKNIEENEKKIQLLAYIRLLDREIRKSQREEYISHYRECIIKLTEELDNLLLVN